MKKILCLIFTFMLMMDVYAKELNSKYAYVYNVSENKVMYEKDSKKEIPVASLTKIMTAIIVIENNENLDKKIEILDYDLRDMYEYAVAGFKAHEIVTIKDLLYGILLPSGSDAVNAAVRVTSENEIEFIKLMNEKAKELKLNNTYFSNPIGKDEGNYSSMYDIAKLLEYALKNKVFREIFTTSQYSVNDLSLKGPLYRINSELLKGAKTGFTYDSMYSLASFGETENFNYIVITSYSGSYKEVMDDHINIYSYYYNNYGYHDYYIDFDIEILNSKEKYYNVTTNELLYLENNYDKELLTYKYDGIKKINKDVKINDKLGLLSIYYDNELIGMKDVYLTRVIEYKNYVWINFIFAACLFTLIVIILIKKKKR